MARSEMSPKYFNRIKKLTPGKIYQGYLLLKRLVVDPREITFSEIEQISPELEIFWTSRLYALTTALKGLLLHRQSATPGNPTTHKK